MEHRTGTELYVALPSSLEIISWDDGSDPEPGMPDHIYRFGSKDRFLEAWRKVVGS